MVEARARGVTRTAQRTRRPEPMQAGRGSRGTAMPPAGAEPPLPELADGLHSLAIHLLRRLRREDAAMGLSPARSSVLSVLVFRGSCSLRELADAEQVSAPTMSRMISAMAVAGLVRRRRHPGDARAVRIEATARGRRILEGGRARRVERLTELLARVDHDQRALVGEAVAVLEEMLRPEHGAE